MIYRKYYISIFKKMGFTRVIQKTDDIIDENIIKEKVEESLSNLEFILKNIKYKENEDGLPIDGEKEFRQRILINIHNETPKNIKEGMGLEGKYVEIYYNQN
ncbi:MAG: hypothetical protein Q9M97_01965 [Candidatus Gracilibacteria bacterium]|nr:hypothetical protein [Candidatus Gracilibacteria bacterium]